MTTMDVQPGTQLAEALQNAIQPKLAEKGWSSGAGDDVALSEYIILMLSNGKDQGQIATELATDLLGLEPNDAGAADFVRWLFDQVAVLSGQSNGAPPQQSQPEASFTRATGDDSAAQDATMSGGTDTAGAGAVPTGPKSMRNGNGAGAQRGRDRRMAGQMRNAMERSGDSGMHRVKGATSRISSHDRGPPRGMASKMQNMMAGGGRGGQGMNTQMMQNMAQSVPPQQQMQLFQMLEEQSRMMAQILGGPQGQQAAFNPKSFNNGRGRGGKSLFDRVDRGGRHQNGHHRQQKQDQPAEGDDAAMAEDGSKKPAAEVPCKFQLQCTSPTCPYAHQSPAAAPGISIDVSDTCTYGAACTNKKCVGSHPSPAQRRQHLSSSVDCKFFPNCTNPACPFRHPTTLPCRNGADCPQQDSGCRFSHSTIQCRYKPCLNPHCVFKHEEGQKQSNQWKGDHVSERKFDSAEGQEELILPGRMEQDGEDVQQQQPQQPQHDGMGDRPMDQGPEDLVA